MKKQIITLAVLFLMGSAACMAQDQPQGGRPDMSKRVEKMIKELGLNDAQAKDFKSAMEEMHPGKNNGERPSREEMQKKREASDAKIKAILTADQYTKYQEMRKNMRQGRPNNNDKVQ